MCGGKAYLLGKISFATASRNLLSVMIFDQASARSTEETNIHEW
jgi:hypothetical protein